MRTSRYIVLLYASVALLGLLMFLNLAAYAFSSSPLVVIVKVLLVIDLLTFAIMGGLEVFYRKRPSKGIPFVTEYKNTEMSMPIEKASRYEKQISLNIKRFDNEKKQFRKDTYVLNVNRFTTVLDALLDIKSKYDNSLSMRYSCRMGICGSCGMDIDGKPCLACETNVLGISGKEITVSPMMAHPQLKDLVTDFEEFFTKHKSIEPNLFRTNKKKQFDAKEVYPQTALDADKFLPYSFCIMCGLCLDACPVVNSNSEFIGPQALSQAYRYYMDSRDQMGGKRLTIIDKLEGVWGCEYAEACSDVCPEGVDPATAIQLLKAEIIKDYVQKTTKKQEQDI